MDIGKEGNLWKPAESMSGRIKKLRDEYFSFYERDYFRNEVMPFTTGTAWDEVWTPHHWGVVPEMYMFFKTFQDNLLTLARPVELPEGFWENSLVKRRAIFFKEVIEKHLPIKILDGELIVGSYFNTALSKCLNKKESRQWKKEEDVWFKEVEFVNSQGIGNAGAIPGHIIPNYAKVVEIGLKGIHNEIEKIKEKISARHNKHLDFLESLQITLLGAKNFAHRYADEAERLAQKEEDSARKEELEEISRICRKVPWEKATSFYEALQSVWFAHMLIMAQESYPGPGLSPGRIDQYLYPLYKRDIESGQLTRDQAKEILESYWIKHNYAYDYQGRVASNQGINSGFGQLITISGLGPNGEDMTNDLTWLIFDVIEEMNMLEPKPNVRIHENTPDDVMRRIAQMIIKAQGSPFLINFDETSIKGLAWQGLPKDELWDYAPVGCLENTLQGNDRSGTVDVNINLAKPIELILNRGKDMASGKKIGSDTGDATKFLKFEDFWEAYKAQFRTMLEKLLEVSNKADYIRSKFEPTPYLSTLIDGCAISGRDITQGGAIHNYITVEGIGFATTADSLMAVKKLIFDDKRISMKELIDGVFANFEGHERLKELLLNKAPKYGNDEDEADSLARDLSRFWTEEVFKHYSPATGRRYRGGYLSWNYFISYAPVTSATPDGRERGRFLSNAINPVNGVDRNGPTVVARSVGKLGLETAPNGDSHIMSFNPSMLRDPEHIDKFIAFLKAYTKLGGTALQVNLVSAETLKEAQKKPEEYKNLLVRVTGYNAYFVMLGREMQEEIIRREVHNI